MNGEALMFWYMAVFGAGPLALYFLVRVAAATAGVDGCTPRPRSRGDSEARAREARRRAADAWTSYERRMGRRDTDHIHRGSHAHRP